MSKQWLITWTTYGSWLPGDSRGFRTWRGREFVPPPARYVSSGQESYNPADYSERLEKALEAVPEPVHLSVDQQKEVLNTIVAEIDDLPLVPAVIAVDATHVHLLASFGKLKIRKVVCRLKSVVTRAIKSDTFQPKRLWAKNCHMRSMNSEDAFRNAFRYVRNHQKRDAFVHVWRDAEDQPSDGEAVGLGI